MLARSLRCWVSMGECYVIYEAGLFCDHVLPFLLHHGPEPWIRKEHWVYGQCDQFCGCCRSHNPEDAVRGTKCEVCYQGWIVTRVSCGWKESAQACARKYSRRNVLCKCGTCPDEYVLCRYLWLPRWRRTVQRWRRLVLGAVQGSAQTSRAGLCTEVFAPKRVVQVRDLP